MKIASFSHKGLKRLYTRDSAKGLPPESVGKLRNILAFLQVIRDVDLEDYH